MADNTVKNQIATKIFALLEANADFVALIPAGRASRPSGARGWLAPLLQKGWSDFPACKMSNGRFTHSAYNIPDGMTYAMEQVGFSGEWIVERELTFKLSIIGRDLDSSHIDPAEEAAQDALLAGGPRLGLAVVKRWKLVAEQAEYNDNGTKRLRSVILITVTTDQNGSDLV